MLIPTVFIKANYRQLLLAARESDTENTLNGVWSAWWSMSDQGSGAVQFFYKSITQLQQQGCRQAKLQGCLLCLLSKSPRPLWPPFPLWQNAFCFTQCSSSSIYFGVHSCALRRTVFCPSTPSSRAHCAHWATSHLHILWQPCTGGPHICTNGLRVPHFFQQMQIKFAARSDGNMSGSMLVSASCLGHGSSIFASSLLKNNHSE